MKRITGSTFIISLLLTSLLITSCGPRVIARAVLLWSPDENSVASGTIVDIIGESDLRSSYDIRFTDNNGHVQTVEIANWKVAEGKNQDELDKIRSDYEQYAPDYGVSEIQALPVRSSMDTGPSSSIVYRLRQGEKVKILGRSDEQVAVGNLTDYWFQILTETGTRGYVFGYRLKLVNASGVSQEQNSDEQDEFLAAILNNVWRPDYFSWMIRDNTYDLSRFRSEYKFTHDAENKTFTLVTEDFNQTFHYDEIFKAKYKEYGASGSGLLITYRDENNIAIQFSVDGETYQENLVRLDPDIDQIIQDEITRRQDLLDNFVAQGTRLTSSSYGTITLDENGTLDWQRFGGLDASMIPSWFTGKAQLSFNLYITSSLKGSYDGALSITQPGRGIDQSMNFFYRFTNGGLQLEYIPSQNINRNVIVKQALSPFIIFFNLSQ